MLFVGMKRIVQFFLFTALMASACSDSFNDPNPDYEEIIDLVDPEINLLSLKADSIYTGTDTLPIHIEFTDDWLLDIVTFDLVPFDNSAPDIKIFKYVEGTSFVLDTFYVVPIGLDSLEIGIVAACQDYATNTAQESLTVKVVK